MKFFQEGFLQRNNEMGCLMSTEQDDQASENKATAQIIDPDLTMEEIGERVFCFACVVGWLSRKQWGLRLWIRCNQCDQYIPQRVVR